MGKEQDFNIILSGLYSEKRIIILKNGVAFVSGEDVFISKETVSDIKIINTQEGNALEGAIIAGVIGAIVMANEGAFSLIEINWISGEKSLAKVSKEDANHLIIASYNSFENKYTTKEKGIIFDIFKKSKEEVWRIIDTKKRVGISSLLILGILFILVGVVGFLQFIETFKIGYIFMFLFSPAIGIVSIVEFVQQRDEKKLKEIAIKEKIETKE